MNGVLGQNAVRLATQEQGLEPEPATQTRQCHVTVTAKKLRTAIHTAAYLMVNYINKIIEFFVKHKLNPLPNNKVFDWSNFKWVNRCTLSLVQMVRFVINQNRTEHYFINPFPNDKIYNLPN